MNSVVMARLAAAFWFCNRTPTATRCEHKVPSRFAPEFLSAEPIHWFPARKFSTWARHS